MMSFRGQVIVVLATVAITLFLEQHGSHRHIHHVQAFTTPPQSATTTSAISIHKEAVAKKKQQQEPSTLLYAIPTIDNWEISKSNSAMGRVSNHPSPTILDGEMITTSTLKTSKDQMKEGSIVSTSSGSKYKLGKPKYAPVVAAPEKIKNVNTNVKTSPSISFGSFRNWGKPKNGASAAPKAAAASSSKRNTKAIKMNDWFISFRGELIGVVQGHPDRSISDGDTITTSKIEGNRNSLKEGDVVSTSSGSEYVLGSKKKGIVSNLFNNNNGISSDSAQSRGGTFKSGVLVGPPSPTLDSPVPSRDASNPKQLDRNRLRELKKEFGVNGKTLGNGKYLLCDRPRRSTSGKSNIWSAYLANSNGNPVGEKLTIKVSTNFESMTRENFNYNRVCSGLFPGRFVEKAEFLESCDGYPEKEFETSCALVIENGRKDLRAILNERGLRGFEGRAMRDASSAALQCIQAMHSSGIVWTDLKTENFVIVSDEIGDNGMLPGVKGIDLESAIKRGLNPVDFSPEACPPEFATAFINGQGLSFKLDYSYDIWSYGMMLFELTTGLPYFDGKTPAQITMALQYEFEPDLSAVEDDKLRDLIGQCLRYDPKKRPGVAQLLLHPYFLTSGIGPFGW